MRRSDTAAVARLEALSRGPGAPPAAAPRGARPAWPAEPWDLDAWPDYPPDDLLAADTTPTRRLPPVTAEIPPTLWAPRRGFVDRLRVRLPAAVPAPLRSGRWDPGRRGLVLVGLLGLLAALAAAAFALHGRAHGVALTPAPAPTDASRDPSDDPLALGPSVQVDVEGRVRRPGLVSLPTGSRVAQALSAAGGVLSGTDTSALDLAQKITDGQQLRVGLPATAAVPAVGSTDAPAGPVDLNTATADQLDTLPHVGPATAAKIVAWRAEHGAFTAVSQLRQVSGIGPSTYEDIAPLVTV